MKGIIYKATNRQDGKIYIGQTIQTLEKRIRSHVRDAKKHPEYPFYRALNEVGAEGFDWEVIETVEVDVPPSMEEAGRYFIKPKLLEAESRHIMESKAYQPEVGYNVLAMGIPGGLSPEKTNRPYRVVLYRLSNGKRFRAYTALRDAVKELGWSRVHTRLIDYDPDGIRLTAPKHVRYVGVKVSKGVEAPEVIQIERSFPVYKELWVKQHPDAREKRRREEFEARRKALRQEWKEKNSQRLQKLQQLDEVE
ncbi:MAG: GIY-YIG nuclease family protein [Lachnospiraceae bacterium]|nr:GIY-YIG nuclease family protein [Lachnospiraceae bacterium]